ncbi:hypothetical protein [Natrialba taiwanensis]|uniref:Amidohydrolase n=1 Tax=Natrialba taiwanensis DSM 12281 TaxID=1230458 RepID=L9ZKY1_9EURY|nr:hypothetical protein [Natrialba taiwanensis]ELY86217.1 amidohydrolase [Natrialba taiwanensis DSM 12281]
MTRIDTLLTGGTVVTTESSFDAAVAIDDETIVGVRTERMLPTANRRIDVSGNLILPGVVDLPVHVTGYNLIDSYEIGTSVAAAGDATVSLTSRSKGGRTGLEVALHSGLE